MNNLISLPDLTEEELEKIISEIYPKKRQYVSENCNGGCRKKGNKIMCTDLCKNSINFIEQDLNSIKLGILKRLNMSIESFVNLKIEEKILKSYIVNIVNGILLKKELEN